MCLSQFKGKLSIKSLTSSMSLNFIALLLSLILFLILNKPVCKINNSSNTKRSLETKSPPKTQENEY